ncbi:hypothetical protein B0T21DRAFT_355979, partial [Apiosordaria backusii]
MKQAYMRWTFSFLCRWKIFLMFLIMYFGFCFVLVTTYPALLLSLFEFSLLLRFERKVLSSSSCYLWTVRGCFASLILLFVVQVEVAVAVVGVDSLSFSLFRSSCCSQMAWKSLGGWLPIMAWKHTRFMMMTHKTINDVMIDDHIYYLARSSFFVAMELKAMFLPY